MCSRSRKKNNDDGMTLVEVLVGMMIFAIGLLGLSRVTFQVMRANMQSRHTVVATNLAHQRMEQIMSSTRYGSITEANFPDEDYGQVNGGASDYAIYSRSVAIADSLNSLGNSVLKEITVRVEWNESGRTRNVELNSSISKFKDIQL
ncbi:MAG: prepilin-type N-terminal cleavage/methylation domain-containing protein [bacterium]|nr:MAG: prepilin-type N-terminal cleavage/methylation domain-containing protein [bacterium]